MLSGHKPTKWSEITDQDLTGRREDTVSMFEQLDGRLDQSLENDFGDEDDTGSGYEQLERQLNRSLENDFGNGRFSTSPLSFPKWIQN